MTDKKNPDLGGRIPPGDAQVLGREVHDELKRRGAFSNIGPEKRREQGPKYPVSKLVERITKTLADINRKYTEEYTAYRTEIARPMDERIIERHEYNDLHQSPEEVRAGAQQTVFLQQQTAEENLWNMARERSFLEGTLARLQQIAPNEDAAQVLKAWQAAAAKDLQHAFEENDQLEKDKTAHNTVRRDAAFRLANEQYRMAKLQEWIRP